MHHLYLQLVDEHLVHVVDQELDEAVDVADVSQGQLLVPGPGQVGSKHHGQVRGCHLVHVTPVIDQDQELGQVFEDGVVTFRQLLDDQILTVSKSALSGNVGIKSWIRDKKCYVYNKPAK